jgi:hypothetical protein
MEFVSARFDNYVDHSSAQGEGFLTQQAGVENERGV